MKLLSVVIPVLNDMRIIDALNSISQNDQTEIIVIDGLSDKNITEKMRNNQSIDIFVSEKDEGFYDAVNKGIDLASGKWIFFLAADDMLLVDLIDIIGTYDDNDCDVICGDVLERLSEEKYRFHYSDPNLEKLKYTCSLRHPATLFKKEVFEKYGKYSAGYKCAGDREMFLRLYTQGASIKIIKEVITLFSLGGMSTKKPIYWYVTEDIKISDQYKVNKLYSRFFLVKIVLNVFGHVVKDKLGLKHKMRLYSKNEAMALIGKGKTRI